MAEKSVKKEHRLHLRLDERTYKRLEYWATLKQVTIAKYVQDAIDLAIDYENGNFHIDNVFDGRMVQMVDAFNAQSSSFNNMSDAMFTFMKMMTDMIRGENYLDDNKEDGELE